MFSKRKFLGILNWYHHVKAIETRVESTLRSQDRKKGRSYIPVHITRIFWGEFYAQNRTAKLYLNNQYITGGNIKSEKVLESKFYMKTEEERENNSLTPKI